jgi:hypothetical protein
MGTPNSVNHRPSHEDNLMTLKYVRVLATQEMNQIYLDGDLHLNTDSILEK